MDFVRISFPPQSFIVGQHLKVNLETLDGLSYQDLLDTSQEFIFNVTLNGVNQDLVDNGIPINSTLARFSILPQDAGTFRIDVIVDRDHVDGSPFSVDIVASSQSHPLQQIIRTPGPLTSSPFGLAFLVTRHDLWISDKEDETVSVFRQTGAPVHVIPLGGGRRHPNTAYPYTEGRVSPRGISCLPDRRHPLVFLVVKEGIRIHHGQPPNFRFLQFISPPDNLGPHFDFWGISTSKLDPLVAVADADTSRILFFRINLSSPLLDPTEEQPCCSTSVSAAPPPPPAPQEEEEDVIELSSDEEDAAAGPQQPQPQLQDEDEDEGEEEQPLPNPDPDVPIGNPEEILQFIRAVNIPTDARDSLRGISFRENTGPLEPYFLYIVDRRGNKIFRLESRLPALLQLGNFTPQQFAIPDGVLNNPTGIALDLLDNVLVTDGKHHLPQIVNQQGQLEHYSLSLEENRRHAEEGLVNICYIGVGVFATLSETGFVTCYTHLPNLIV